MAYAEISPRDREGTMVINLHDYRRGNAIFPGVISEGFAQRMTGYALWEIEDFGGGADYAVGLDSAYGFSGRAV